MNDSDQHRQGNGFAMSLDGMLCSDSRHRHAILARTVAGIVCLQLSLPVAALGIGEPRHVSRLFEPLRLDIPIDADASDQELHVRLMMRTEADGAAAADTPGLRREFLTDADGQRILRVTTLSAIREPVMLLHVDLSGHGVQLQRDLTLLFDPPADAPASVFVAGQPSAPLAAEQVPSDNGDTAVAASAGMVAVTPSTARRSSSNALAGHAARRGAPQASQRPVTAAVSAPAGWRRTLPVRLGETLAQVAERIRPSRDTAIGTMAMLLRWHNPRAFDLHTGELLTGAQLRFPGRSEIAAQLAAFSPDAPTTASVQVASSAAGIPAAPATVAMAEPVPAPATREGLHFADDLSAGSLALLGSVAGGFVPAANAGTSAVAAPTAAPIVVAALSPPFNPAPAAVASSLAVPVPTIFPAWLIAAALMLSGGMVWIFARLLRNTPKPMSPPGKRAFARVSAAPPALVDEWMDGVAVVTPSLREAPKRNAHRVDMDVPETHKAPLAATSPLGWTPEQFDLSQIDEEADDQDDATSGADRRLPRSHPSESPEVMAGRRSDVRKG